MFYRLVFSFILLISNSSKAFAQQSCQGLLSSSSSSKVLDSFLVKINTINPELVNQFYKLNPRDQNLKNLYLIVKKEAWIFLPNGYVPWSNKPSIVDKVLQNVRNYPNPSYNTRDLSDEDVYMFYSNALQGLYIAISNAIRLSLISAISPNAKKTLRVFLEVVYEDVILVDLGLAEVSPERTEEAFKEDLLNTIDWNALIHIFESWKNSNSEDLERWVDENEELFSAYKKELSLFRRNINRSLNNKRHCCKNTPGCLFCPNNRNFLTPKNSRKD